MDKASYKVVLPIYFVKNKKKQQQVLLGINWYRNAHWAQAGNAKKFIAELIEEELGGIAMLNGPVHLHYDVFVKRANIDGGNVRSILEKFALDGFVEAKIILDDNIDIVRTTSDAYFLDKEFPRIEITISEHSN